MRCGRFANGRRPPASLTLPPVFLNWRGWGCSTSGRRLRPNRGTNSVDQHLGCLPFGVSPLRRLRRGRPFLQGLTIECAIKVISIKIQWQGTDFRLLPADISIDLLACGTEHCERERHETSAAAVSPTGGRRGRSSRRL